MMRNALRGLVLLALAGIYVLALGKAGQEKKMMAVGEEESYVLPSPMLRLSALEFKGLASDFLFLKSLVFVGSTFEKGKNRMLSPSEGLWLYHVLDASTYLDPYFLDPYYFGNANLTWGVGLIRESNALLERGSKFRSWDPLLPFYIGFNYFFFLRENDKASEYLMEASRRPDASPVYATLAVKLAYKEKKTENAIIFLEQVRQSTKEPVFRKEYDMILEVLRDILFLEKASTVYKEKFGHYPGQVADLTKKGIIKHVPQDPYGGEFLIDRDGAVKTTSDYMLLPHYSMLNPNLSVSH